VKLTEGEQAYVYAKGTDNLEAYLKSLRINLKSPRGKLQNCKFKFLT